MLKSIPQLDCIGKPIRSLDLTFLHQLPNWVVWRRQLVDGQWKKPLISPKTGRYASATKPITWGTYQEALATLRNKPRNYDGIGFVFSADNPLCGIDLDDCRDPKSGAIAQWAQEIVATLSSYTEISPSGEGLHILICGTLPGGASHKKTMGTHGGIEIYDKERYFTFTGNQLPDTPSTIENRQAQLDALYASLFGTQTQENASRHDSQVIASTPPSPVSSITLTDQQVIEYARRGRNSELFIQLFDHGSIPYYRYKGKDDASRADAALCGILAFYTRKDSVQIDRLFRQSHLYRPKWDDKRGDQTYGERTIEVAIGNCTKVYDPDFGRKTRLIHSSSRKATPLLHIQAHHSGNRAITATEHQKQLREIPERIKTEVKVHIDNQEKEILLALAPPGVGKSYAAAELGEQTTIHKEGEYNIAWISYMKERFVPALLHYQQIQACTQANCPDHLLHNILGEKGYNTRSVHSQHETPCEYTLQFHKPGSKLYQLAHIRTSYVTHHQGVIVDECNIPSLLPEREISMYALSRAITTSPEGSTAERLLLALQTLVREAERRKTPLHGKALFDELDKACGNKLYDMLVELRNTKHYQDTHPWAPIDINTNEAATEATRLTPVVLPHLLHAFDQELLTWRTGDAWNSLIRLGSGRNGWSLFLTEPLAFTSPSFSLSVLDATGDAELLTRLWERPVIVKRHTIPPAPGSQHIAVRTGKRYGKLSLVAKGRGGTQPDLQRAIAQCRYMLHKFDPTGQHCANGKVGLITFAQCEEQMRRALNIPEGNSGHFWAMRGSNRLEECEILLVVGTPTLRPDELFRLARALWRKDSTPIDETPPEKDENNLLVFKDPRVQKLSDHLINAELTQCAHRNRPLRYPNRTVITFCLGEIDYLPPTRTYTTLPRLTPDGQEQSVVKQAQDEQKLNTAWDLLTSRGKEVTVRALKETAHVATDTAAAYRRKRLSSESSSTTEEALPIATVSPPPQPCFSPTLVVPEIPRENISSEVRNSSLEQREPTSITANSPSRPTWRSVSTSSPACPQRGPNVGVTREYVHAARPPNDPSKRSLSISP